jgi:hypothetical protein
VNPDRTARDLYPICIKLGLQDYISAERCCWEHTLADLDNVLMGVRTFGHTETIFFTQSGLPECEFEAFRDFFLEIDILFQPKVLDWLICAEIYFSRQNFAPQDI